MNGWKHLGCGTIFPATRRWKGPPAPCPVCGDKPSLTPGWRKAKMKWVPKKDRAGLANRRLRRRVLERDGFACVECGSNQRLEIDHIRPRVRGGKNDLDNLQVLCHECNAAKGSALPAMA